MKFPSVEFVQALQERMNGDAKFHTASRWSDVKVLLSFGERRYWLKLYGGKILDVMDYFPMANPLGWDYMISAPMEIWRALRDGSWNIDRLLLVRLYRLYPSLLDAIVIVQPETVLRWHRRGRAHTTTHTSSRIRFSGGTGDGSKTFISESLSGLRCRAARGAGQVGG